MIKGVVDLDGVKVFGVMGKPLGLGQIFGVKGTAPVFVMISRRADAQCSSRTAHRKPPITGPLLCLSHVLDAQVLRVLFFSVIRPSLTTPNLPTVK